MLTRATTPARGSLGATADLLRRGGLPAVTIEAVSAASGICKLTIYRYWPNRPLPAIDAFAEQMTRDVPIADTGDSRADLIEQVRNVASYYTSPAGGILTQLLGAGTTDPTAAGRLRDRFFAGRRAQTRVDTTAPVPRVLVIGLDPYRVPGPWDPKPVADAIEVGLTRFAEHSVGVETCLFGLDGSDDVEAIISGALRARPWECVVVGGGVRKPEDRRTINALPGKLARQAYALFPPSSSKWAAVM